MKALCWHGKHDIRYERVPDPRIEEPRDAIIKVSACAICGSDLHLFDGFMPGMEAGDVMGHEFMGEVVEVGSGNRRLKVGDRVVVPFTICCGECPQCLRGNWSVCERSNRNKALADKMFGHSTAGLFGYTHLTGGYAGGQAEYVRVPTENLIPIADNVDFVTAAAVPIAYGTAIRMLFEIGQVQPGNLVLILGASGGVGVACACCPPTAWLRFGPVPWPPSTG